MQRTLFWLRRKTWHVGAADGTHQTST